ncbi:MAG: DUF368 domain-containing protein [Defluviitaleaceae bacterium]|nr:DUF368 domain-containing protein [Defluviitaleaceae bacterium]
MKKIIKAFLYGVIFGLGSPIPGVSAGTVALLLNVYDDFFKSIGIDYVKNNIGGVISFLLGWGIGLLSISHFIMFLFNNHEQVVSFIFIGLILGCVPPVYKKATIKKPNAFNIITCITAFLFMVFLTFFSDNAVAGTYSSNLVWVFFASFFSSMAMIIPGVGGSLMMLAFGIYAVYIESVATLNPVMLTIFGVSMVLGVLTGIAITKKMLEKFSQALYFAILGFVLGSLLILFPGIWLDFTSAVALVTGCICFIFAYWLSKKEA